jgi:hypothetical protein
MLVLWANLNINISFSRHEAEEERDGKIARLENVLSRADALYHPLAQQGPGM